MDNKTNSSDTQLTQQSSTLDSRARYRCPEKLAQLLALLNLISDATIEKYNAFTRLNDEVKLAYWAEIFNELPDKLKEWIVDSAKFDAESFITADKNYYDYLLVFENLLAVRAFLKNIQQIGKSFSKTINNPLSPDELTIEPRNFQSALKNLLSLERAGKTSFPNFSGLINVKILPDFTMKFTLSPLVEMISESDIRRIRQCFFCSNFFWAERMDALGCTRQCSNALRQRRLREARLKSTE